MISSLSNNTPSTAIYTLSLHDALPIYPRARALQRSPPCRTGYQLYAGVNEANATRQPGRTKVTRRAVTKRRGDESQRAKRSEEHTSELQSRLHLVCRLLLEKKKEHIKL